MAEPAVLNASPIIFLAGAGLIDLARLAGEPLLIPQRVVEEIERFTPPDAAVSAVRQRDWFRIVETGPPPSLIERWDLGAGETSVLTWAYSHPGTTAILDDLAARRCANLLGIPLRGTLGLVLLAKQRQVIPKARPIVEQLRKSGMYLSDYVVDRALKMIGE